jgi:hypothetical protein
MTPQLRSRLENWKFCQALALATEASEPDQRLIAALAALVGDCGWGLEGALATVIDAAVDRLLAEDA